MKTAAPIIAILAAGLLASCSSEPAVPQPDVTVQQLMEGGVQPTAEIYWGAVQYISDETGDHDIFPKTDKEWERARLAAAKIGEFGEMLGKPEYANGRGEDWVEFSKALVEVAKKAEQTAIDKDVEGVFETGGLVYRVCSACHMSYPPENVPDDGPA